MFGFVASYWICDLGQNQDLLFMGCPSQWLVSNTGTVSTQKLHQVVRLGRNLGYGAKNFRSALSDRNMILSIFMISIEHVEETAVLHILYAETAMEVITVNRVDYSAKGSRYV